jgi:mono/diheme cytochrome c family protein
MGIALVCALWAIGPVVRAEQVHNSANVDFIRDIRPIFENNCYKCHDADKHKGGLRLDSKQTAFIGGDSGEQSIVPGDPDHSKLIQLVRGDDPMSVMPPKGDRLAKEQVDALVRWVKQGAAWPDGIDKPAAALKHWSFSKPVRPQIPKVAHQAWVRNAIDSFVVARLEQEGLAPSADADKYALVRRVYLDLIGLPPSPAEVDQFVNDSSPDAYEKLVDRLLANPHFGERWARMWMDVARYADSAGYGSDPLRFVTWRWRDWVINAFNRDLPYDQFTIQQIAGDLLPNPTTDQLIATAFNRNTMTNTEGGTDPEEFRVAAVKDRVDTTIQAWMGLTMGCAQCHSHKYDPITNREYYQLFAIFNQTQDANRPDEAPTIETPTPEVQSQIEQARAKIAAAQAKLNDRNAWATQQARWERAIAREDEKWTVLDAESFTSLGGATLTRLYDGSLLASGNRAANDTYVISANPAVKKITALRIDALPDPTLAHAGPGRADDGSFALSDLRVTIDPRQPTPPVGRFVRIEMPGTQKILALAEVQVFSGEQNIALKGKASQSSTDFGGDPQLAIDGNTSGDFAKHSVSHTKKSRNPWWEVDLNSGVALDRIAIWNRTDNGLEDRLSDFRVIVLDEKRNIVWQQQVASSPKPSVTLSLSGPRMIALSNATDDSHSAGEEGSAAQALMAARSGAWNSSASGVAQTAVFETAADVQLDGAPLTIRLHTNKPNAALGRFRISVTSEARPHRAIPRDVLAALALAPERRSEQQKSTVFAYFSAYAPQLQPQRSHIAMLQKQLADIKIPRTAVMRELPPDRRRENRVLVKGNFLNKGVAVQPAVLAAFNPLPKGAEPNRLGLAKWIVDDDNPLTARVAVNRFWAQLFGVGIVETQEDFGTQGQPPSNQQLLDWLAVELMHPSVCVGSSDSASDARAWDIKRLIKLIVMSSAYRQSSKVTPEALAKDPHNRLISRGPRVRLEAELVRDQALALSGLLSHKMFGPSVFPPQPAGLWQAAFNGERTWTTSTGEDKYRRGVYVFWRRTVPYPSMNTFDAPTREVCTLRRIQTSTPLQAFVTLNDPVYVEAAQALARRIINEGGETAEARAKYGLMLCLCRPPEPQQVKMLLDLHDRELSRYKDDESGAKKLASDPLGPLPKDVDAADAAAWTVCANVLLNVDGVLCKR